MTDKSYSEMIQYASFEDRLEYLRLRGGVGHETFGFDRYLNQRFYLSREWQEVRNFVILRDDGCDLGVEGYEIPFKPLIHHINPMTPDDIIEHADWILDPEYLITTSHRTHNAIHYGGDASHPRVVVQRTPNDTKLW